MEMPVSLSAIITLLSFALMPYLGHKAALKVLGRDEGRTAFDDIPFTAVPFYNGTAWFRPFMTWWYRARDAMRSS